MRGETHPTCTLTTHLTFVPVVPVPSLSKPFHVKVGLTLPGGDHHSSHFPNSYGGASLIVHVSHYMCLL